MICALGSVFGSAGEAVIGSAEVVAIGSILALGIDQISVPKFWYSKKAVYAIFRSTAMLLIDVSVFGCASPRTTRSVRKASKNSGSASANLP